MNKNHVFALLAGVSAAAVTVLSVGGYLLHRKVLNYRLQEQNMRLAMLDMDDDEDYEDYDEDEEYDEYDKLFEDFAEEGILFHVKGEDDDR